MTSTELLPSGAALHRWTSPDPVATLVLHHGFAEYATRWVDQHRGFVGRATATGLDVLAPDLWGHGSSPGRRGVVHVGRAVSDALAARARAAPARPVFLLGHSLGGLVAAASGSAEPTGVDGIVLLAPALPAVPRVVRRLLGALAVIAPGHAIPRRPRPAAELSHDPAVGERARTDPAMHHGQVPLLLAATALDAADRVRATAVRWQFPLLVIHGTADTYTDPTASRALVDSVGSRDRTWHGVDGARHELLQDMDAADVSALVLEWIHQRAAGR